MADKRSAREIRPSKCAVCRHPDRARIELLRVNGASLDALGREFAPVSRDSIFRHFRFHVTEKRKVELLAGPARVADLANAAAKENRSLLDYYIMIRGILTNQLFNCAEANDTHGVGLIAGKLDDNLGSIARLTGEVGKLTFTQINNTMINNFASSPAYIKLVEVVLEQLSDLPERRAAIVEAIRGLNDDPPTRSSFIEQKPSLQCETIEGEVTGVE